MKISLFDRSDSQAIITLFTDVFSVAEGEKEGQVIGNLVANLMTKTKPQDLTVCVARDKNRVIGGICFSRLIVPSKQLAFILSPLAVATPYQRAGIGQQLIHYGLDHLRSLDVSLVFTYGNPAFYCKTGFKQITEEQVSAPFALSQPMGWLAQSLDDKPILAMQGATQCVEALSDPRYW